MENQIYRQLVDQLRNALVANNYVEFNIYFFEHEYNFKIQLGELVDEDIGQLYSILHSWFHSDFFYYKQNILKNYNAISGRIYLVENEPFLSIEFHGPYNEEFDEFNHQFNFDKNWFLNTLVMVNDDFVCSLTNFDIDKVFIDCKIEQYSKGQPCHDFDLVLFYLDSDEIEYTWNLTDNQKQIVRDYILNIVLTNVLPLLDVPNECVQTYDSIFIYEDVDFNNIEIGNISTSEFLVSFNDIQSLITAQG